MVLHIGPAQDASKCKVRCVLHPHKALTAANQRLLLATLDALNGKMATSVTVDRGHAHGDGKSTEACFWLSDVVTNTAAVTNTSQLTGEWEPMTPTPVAAPHQDDVPHTTLATPLTPRQDMPSSEPPTVTQASRVVDDMDVDDAVESGGGKRNKGKGMGACTAGVLATGSQGRYRELDDAGDMTRPFMDSDGVLKYCRNGTWRHWVDKRWRVSPTRY